MGFAKDNTDFGEVAPDRLARFDCFGIVTAIGSATMNKLRSQFVAWLAPVALALASCGGSGHGTGSSSASLKPELTIGWAQRTRDITGPASALSVVVVFQAADAKGQDVTFEADRNANPAAYSQAYVCPSAVTSNSISMQIRFHAHPSGTGAVVGTADADVKVMPGGRLVLANGAAFSTVQVQGTVSSVEIPIGQSLVVGQPGDLNVAAFDLAGDLIAVTPGSVQYTITPGTATASVNSVGQIVAQSTGSIYVTATVDGHASNPMGVSVTPVPAAYTTLPQITNAMTLDPVTGHLWATVPSTAPTFGNSLVEIDPASHAIIANVSVGSEPGALAISDDGSYVYVCLAGADAIAKVDAKAHTLVTTFPVVPPQGSAAQYPTGIAVQPGNSDVVAVVQQDQGDSGYNGPTIYKGGVPLPKFLGVYQGNSFAFTAATTIWSADTYSSPHYLYKSQLDATGVTVQNSWQGGGDVLKSFGGNLYLDDGQELNGQTGSLIGTFPDDGDITVDLAAKRAFVLPFYYGQVDATLDVFDTTTFKPVTQVVLKGLDLSNLYEMNLVRVGAKGLAFRGPNGVYFIDQYPIGLG